MSKETSLVQAEKFAKAGKLDKAIRELEKVIAVDPLDMRVRLKAADLYVKKKEIAAAIRIYQEVARYYVKEKFHLKAIAVYKTILKLNPSSIDVNEKLGDLYREVGLDNDAVNQYYIVAGYYDGKGITKEAMEIRKKIIEIDPANTTGRIRLAELMQASGKADESLQEYERAADLLKQKKDRDGLAEVYEKILYYRPENLAMLVDLCRIYFDRREYKKVLRRVESAPGAVKQDAAILEIWSEALLEDRQVDAARKKFRDLYARTLQLGDAERAGRTYSRILQEFSDDEDYLNELAELQKEAGVTHREAKPKHRQDFEKTEMVDLNKLDEYLKKK